MDSLEEKVSVFFHGDLSDESDLCLEEEDDDDGPDNSLHDPMERALYWESQEALLQLLALQEYGEVLNFAFETKLE
ncbi:hypothetical protein OIU85_003287 [Salix viminalis]|uniref:Uncharacterized protein n=1 Tax=Salix viminalis TaxID=40686 RepID=A0A9Q0PYU3_SALVM|nr:hypothetical protein OIU85_003287 [Salix viminalis]